MVIHPMNDVVVVLYTNYQKQFNDLMTLEVNENQVKSKFRVLRSGTSRARKRQNIFTQTTYTWKNHMQKIP